MKKIQKWLPLFSTQFLGVLNDNVLKNAIIFIGLFWLAKDDQPLVIPIASALLVLPFLLFSPLAGKWSQTISKKKIFETAKLLEIPIMIIASIGFFMQSIYVVMLAMLLMGLQSALYSPSKYGLIRDVGGVEEVSFGIGTMELLTFVGVLLGQVSAGIISDLQGNSVLVTCIFMIVLAVLGWFTSRKIKVEEPVATKEIHDSVNPIKFLYDSYKWSKKIKGLNYTILGLGGFWLVASMLQMNIYLHAPDFYGMSNTETSIVMALIAIGIGVGCWVAGLISKNKVEIGMVPLGGIGLSICLTLFATVNLNSNLFIILLVVAAFFSGFYKVPLNAWLQERVEGRKLGNILAYNNMVAFAFILIAASIFGYFSTQFDTNVVFVVIAVISWIMTLITLLNIPAMMIRFMADTLAKVYFRYEVVGKENIPKKSGALLVTNHLSLIDPLMIVAVVPRMVRFVMAQELYDHPSINWLVRRLNVIPVSSKSDKERLEKFNQICQKEINEGHIVCIFPEGQISRIGHLLEFKRGIEHISNGINAPIIPIQIEGVKGTPFSFETGESSPIKRLTSFRKRIHVAIGRPIDPPVSAYLIRQQIQELNAETFQKRIASHHTLTHFLDRKIRKLKSNVNIINANGGHWSYFKMFSETNKLKSILIEKAKENEIIGVILPNSRNGLLTNIAISMSGKISINIPPDISEEELDIIIKSHGMTTIITDESSDLNEILSNRLKVFFIEELLNANPSKLFDKINPSVNNLKGNKSDLVTIIYERDEKEVLQVIPLSNENILATIKGLMQTHQLGSKDRILSVLPYNTYYGYILNIWLPLLTEMKVVFCDTSIDVESVARSILDKKANILLAHSSLVEALFQIDRGKVWKTLDYVLTGKEPISQSIKEKLQNEFDLHISESLSFSDIGTLVSVNTPEYNLVDINGQSIEQPGSKEVSYGRCIPGLAVKTVNTKNFDQILDADQPGILLVKGAAISQQNSLSNEKLYKGWYVTGQLCSIDSHGFIRLVDVQ